MTIPVSSVPAVRAYLVGAITTQVADPDVLVVNGDPGTNVPNDVISIASVQRQSSASALVGSGQAKAIEERYTVEVIVSSFAGGDSGADIDARAWALASSVEASVRNDMSLGGLVVVARPGPSHSDGPQWDDEHKGIGCDVYVFVECFTQL